ncbi:hypothetical protein GGH12_006087 [Coemansia sp. RSA 1822]|nr:hypothetical protein LPJ76_006195 [Coemansia sp. RSA 638]KAJ2124829.1 hypothetical protein IW147_001434 [Coemansia sp. RSA 720]KAJ2557809.1 hypothetical protein GGH12_006087 [Coemansia sp. RSA 1822]
MDAKPTPSEAGSDKPRIKMQLYKTEPCQNWAMYGVCRYGNLCKFAHGMNEQRSRYRHPKYKTSLCKDFPLGKCTFGNRCNFAHSLDELRSSLLGGPGSAQLPPTPTNQHMMGQTPVRMLPDGRMLTTYTPILDATPGDLEQDDARGLRRYQSMGTLRAMPAATAPTTAPAIPEATFSAVYDNMPTAFASPTQPLLHLHQEHSNVARRVASLSQLPTLRSSAQPTGSAYLHGLGLTTAAYMPTSPLVHRSPAMSSPSPAEYDTTLVQPVSDSTMVAQNDWMQQPQYMKSAQRRTLTSSISMQTLPRFKVPVAWDSQPSLAGSLNSHNYAVSSQSPAAYHTHNFTVSSQSSATLIDSDVWASTLYSPAMDSAAYKPQESRFFPSADTQPSLSTASPRVFPSSPYNSHHQLRRQQSTDDWVLLRNAQHPASKPLWEPSVPHVAKSLYR